MSKNLAPIVLFVYNRPWHTQKTIEALQKNKLAKQSKLFIYSDAPRDTQAEESVAQVRAYIKNIDGFKTITIIKRDTNWGLANSIIDGVTSIVNKYGKIIVIEDDLVTSPYFLKFMNDGLNFYIDQKKIWHISGWNYPIPSNGLDDVFFWRLMNCWGWATWKDRWQHYEKNIDRTINQFSKDDINRLNLDGAEDCYSQVIDNKEQKINTWAIFWYTTIFKREGLCLNPTQTFVENIGIDGSGVHCGSGETYSSNISLNKNIDFIKSLDENNIALERIKLFYKNNEKPFVTKCINKLSRIVTKALHLK